MISFANPQLLWLLALLPLWLLLRGRRGKVAAVAFPATGIARAAARTPKSRLAGLAPMMRLPAAALLILAMARPQLTHATSEVEASGVDLVLAVDVSGSMEARDLATNGQPESRLSVVKDVVAEFVTGRPGDRIALMAFAQGPYLVSPLTMDHEWLQQNLERVETGMVPDGTAIGSALAASVNRLRETDAESKVVVLLTDGMNNAGSIDPTLAAQAAEELGIQVYTIGVGAEGEAPMPIRRDDGTEEIVMAEVNVDEDTLRAIADTTGGQFFRATDADALAAVYAEIDRMEKTTRTLHRYERHEDTYLWFLWPALALLALELLTGFTLLRRVP